MDRALKRITLMHTAIALVIALSSLAALVAIRTTLERPTPGAEVEAVETTQWFLVIAAMIALGLVIASACVATQALHAQHTKLREVLDAALEAEALSLHREPCNVSVLINDAIRTARLSAREQGIRLRFETPVGFSVHADRARLGTVMSSLLDLQIASASTGALITIETADKSDAVQFTFAADYVAETIGTTFRKPFPLPDDTRVLLAERMIEAHGGELAIDHNPVGVAIRFTIPTT
jgi:signal transduction histidine kinase